MGKNLLKTLAPIAGGILGSTVLPGVGLGLSSLAGGAIGSGGASLATGSTPLQALGSAAGSYIGGNLGGAGNIGPSGTVASGLGSIGFDSAANVLPSSIAGESIGGALGSAAGGNIGSTLLGGPETSKLPSPTGITPFTPSQQGAMSLPSSLSSFGTLTPNQQSTNIATQGVYGGGEGNDENQYFLNLINRKLVDPSGNVGNTSSLSPIESSYLNQLGLGGYSNTNGLLQNISKYNAA